MKRIHIMTGNRNNSCSVPYKLNKLFALVPIILLFASCTKALDNELTEKPKSIAVETYYNTAKEAETGVNAIYIGLHDFITNLNPNVESFTDYSTGRGSMAILSEFQGLSPSYINSAGAMWTSFYQMILNANLIVKNLPKGTNISEEDVARFVGEAKFLRALAYFNLVRYWGRVPIRTEDNLDQNDVPRSPVDSVYQLILSDLEYAEANLGDEPRMIGTPSRWVVKTVLADVYLNMNDFGDARDKADEVIRSNRFSLVPVGNVDDFQNIFGSEIPSTPEEIFYVKFARLAGYGWNWVMLVNHPSTGYHGAGGWFGNAGDSQNPVYQNWDNDDLRKGLWYSLDVGEGPNTLLNKKFIDPLAIASNGAGNDYPMYRYADVLMIYAEAAAKANNGPTSEAMEALNQVHRRAYGLNPVTPSAVDFQLPDYNLSAFMDLVVREYGYEFQEEGKRWSELVRTGKAQEVILASKGKTIAEKCYLWPIPVQELNNNKAMDASADQNPGY